MTSAFGIIEGTSKRVTLLDASSLHRARQVRDVDETANIQFQYVQDYVLDLLNTKVLTYRQQAAEDYLFS